MTEAAVWDVLNQARTTFRSRPASDVTISLPAGKHTIVNETGILLKDLPSLFKKRLCSYIVEMLWMLDRDGTCTGVE